MNLSERFSCLPQILPVLFVGFCLFVTTPQKIHGFSCDEIFISRQCEEKDPYLVKEYTVWGHTSLQVFTPGGDIELLESPDPEKIRVELYVNRGFYGWLFGSNLNNYRITNVKRHNEVIASVEKKSKEQSSFWESHTTFSYKIYIPSSISTSLKTLGGSISIENVTGKQLLKSSGGDISVANANGLVKAYTSGGHIKIADSKGALYAHTNGGNISVEDSMGELRLQTNGGKISSWDISGSMIAKVNGGDIVAHFKKTGHGINLTTAAGNIMIMLPDSTGYNLRANGTSVEMDRNLPFRGTYTSRQVDGSLYGGGVPVYITTSSGTITFKINR